MGGNNKVVLFWIFSSCQGSMRTFPKHYCKCKTVLIKLRKTLQERRLAILKLSQDNPQNNFWNFLTSKNIFITLQYSGDILGIFLKQTFPECSSNILETLLRDYWSLPKDQKTTFPLRTFKKIFSLKMFPKCSLDVLNIATLGKHTANILDILHAGLEVYVMFMVTNLIKPRKGKLTLNHLIGNNCPEFCNGVPDSYFFKLTLWRDCLQLCF